MATIKAREGQWYADKSNHDVFCVIAVDETDGFIDVRDRYGDIDEFDLDEWNAMDLELCAAPPEWNRHSGEGERREHDDTTNDGGRNLRR